jgi:FixJ family two-component response regulator
VGFRVEVFASAAEYLKFKKLDSPACLILDLELPGMSGLELQREIAGGDAPAIVFVTGHGDVPSSLRAMKAAAIEFLLKPFDDQELLRAIDAAIAQDRESAAEKSGDGRVAETLRSSDASRARGLAVRGSRLLNKSRPRPNSATVRSPFRFIGDRSWAKWRPRPWHTW